MATFQINYSVKKVECQPTDNPAIEAGFATLFGEPFQARAAIGHRVTKDRQNRFALRPLAAQGLRSGLEQARVAASQKMSELESTGKGMLSRTDFQASARERYCQHRDGGS